MSALAAATAARSGAASIARGQPDPRARRTAGRDRGHDRDQVTGLADLPAALAAADIVISCTGAAGHVITRDMVSAALTAQEGAAARW